MGAASGPAPDGTFPGVVGRTVRDSTPWWPAPVAAPPGSPNIVVIVVDDVGFADLGCFGSEIETPNIDRLAASGLRYNNFHTTALCSPTRACLLTGRNHHSVGMGVVTNWDTGFPGYRGRIARSAGTLAEILRPAGYNTFATGKWHLTPPEETTAAGPFDQWPVQRGFDRFYGFLDGATDQWTPDLVHDNHPVEPPSRPGYHLTEDIVTRSIQLVRDQVSAHPEKPFFLYMCFGTAHYPLHAPREHVDKYRGTFDRGWDTCRAERLARQTELGIVPAGTELAPRMAGVPAWDELDPDERRLCARLQEAYAGMLDHTDAHIGRFLDSLVDVGQHEQTLVVFLSDNGATLEGGRVGSVNWLRYINGLPDDDLDEALAVLDDIGGPTTSPVYPMGWGQAGNTPLKRFKQNTHGGGVRDPLIVSWPGRITDGGAIRTQYCHAVDVVPTVVDVLGIDPPAELGGVPQQPIEGVSLAPTFGDPAAPSAKQVQYFEMLGNRAVWRDGWKAVTYHAPGQDFDDDRWELYHVAEDFSECHDLASQFPERLDELVDLWWAEAGRHQVLPLDDRILERFHVPKPRPITDRSTFTYYPGARIPSSASPDVRNVSYTITAHVDRPASGGHRLDDGRAGDGRAGDGVIVSCGDRFSGYALFVHDDRLVHDYNCGGVHHVVRSSTPLPTGPSTLEFRFTRTGHLQGVGSLHVDGHEVGSAPIPRTLGTTVGPTGVSIGRSALSPVSDLYDRPFEFAGTIAKVVFEIGDDREAAGPVDIHD
jgi:arylsulfatase A-like enzyme